MTMDGWRVLRRRRDGDVVIAVDFGPGRADAGFADLVPHLGGRFGLWETAFPDPAAPNDPLHETDPRAWARRRAEDLAASGTRVSGIAAYCAGAALALCLADELGSSEPVDAVVLIDPTAPDADVIEHYFRTSVDRWKGHADRSVMEQIGLDRVCEDVKSTAELVRLHEAEYVELMDMVHTEYRGVCRRIGGSIGLPPEFTDDLSDRMRDFVAYLTTSARVPPGELAELAERIPHLTISSRAHRVPKFTVGANVRFECTAQSLLRDESAASRITHELLPPGGSPGDG